MRLAGRGESPGLSSLVLGATDPVDPGISPDGRGRGVHHDHFIVFVGSVLGHPVRVEHAQGSDSSPDGFFCAGFEVLLHFEASHSCSHGLAVANALFDRSLASASSHPGSVNHESLFLAVAQSTGAFDSGRTRHSVDRGQLSVLPSSQTQDELHDFAFFSFPKLLKVFVGTHL